MISKTIKIGNKLVGDSHPCFIIAEAGVNHDGNIKKAFKLVDVAKKAGADAIKFQTFNTEECTHENLKKANYQREGKKDKISQFQMLKKLELDISQHIKIRNYCRKKKIIFFSTPSDYSSLKLLQKIKIPCFKISSVDLTNELLLKQICSTNKPVFISTGMSSKKEIIHSYKITKRIRNKKIIFMHCISSYPTLDKDINLQNINMLKKITNSIVGFSDHTLSVDIPSLAYLAGARVIEKHFTLNNKMQGPDHKISLNPENLKKMINKIRSAEKIIGKERKNIFSCEKNTEQYTKKSFVAFKQIRKGKKLSLNDLILKSSGFGLNYSNIKKFIGKTIKKNIKKNDIIQEKFLR